MLGRYWSVIIVCLALASGQVCAQQNGEQAQTNSSDSSQGEPSRSPFPVVIVQTENNATHDTSREQQADQHDAADLLAQQQAADAAERSAIAAEGQLQPVWLSVWFSAAAVCLSLGALGLGFYTQLSVDRTSRAELRAYVGVEDYEITEINADAAPKAIIRVRNTGHTPAKSIRFRIEIESPKPKGEIVFGETEDRSVFDLGAGMPWPLEVEWTKFPKVRGPFLAGKHEVWVRGVVMYQDVFGKERGTWFKYRLQGSSRVDENGDTLDAVSMAIAADGNHST